MHFASAIVLQQNLPTLEGFRLVCCDNELLEAAQQMGITIDGFDDGGVVAQQNVAEPVGMVGGQLELGGDVEVSEVGLIHIRFLRFRFRKTGNALAVPSEGKIRMAPKGISLTWSKRDVSGDLRGSTLSLPRLEVIPRRSILREVRWEFNRIGLDRSQWFS